LARATQSKDRCEKTIVDGERPTDCLDERRNKAPIVPLLRQRNPLRDVHAKCDRYFSSLCVERMPVRNWMWFLAVAGIGDPGRYEGRAPFARAGITDPG